MIAQPSFGRYLKGIISYNEEKVALQDAKILYCNNINNSVRTFEFQFHSLQKEQAKLKNTIMHLSLNFHESDRAQLTDKFLIDLAQEFLSRSNFPPDHPYVIYQHFDKGHPHLHLVLPTILEDGEVYKSHNTVRRFMPICRDIEKKYGLKVAAKDDLILVNKTMVSSFETVKSAANAALRMVLKRKPAKLKELASLLEKQKFSYNGQENCTLNYALSKRLVGGKSIEGISFFVAHDGKQLTKGIKGSRLIGGSYQNIASIFKANNPTRQKVKFSIKASIMEALSKTKSLNSFTDHLATNGITPKYFSSKTGEIFAVEFEHEKTGMIMKGSDLGKQFSWNGLKTQLSSYIIAIDLAPEDAVSLHMLDIPGIQLVNRGDKFTANIDTSIIALRQLIELIESRKLSTRSLKQRLSTHRTAGQKIG